jgi:hypothetical protein
MGRPRRYKTLEELAARCDEYFEYIMGEHTEELSVNADGKTEKKIKHREPEPATITGLALFLGFVSRQSLYDYINRNDEFSYIVNVALTLVECNYERRLSGTCPTGAIFALKNMNWKDKSETELSGNMGIVWNETKTYEGQTGSAPFPPMLDKKSAVDPETPEQ